jgi:hypothetical protein
MTAILNNPFAFTEFSAATKRSVSSNYTLSRACVLYRPIIGPMHRLFAAALNSCKACAIISVKLFNSRVIPVTGTKEKQQFQ